MTRYAFSACIIAATVCLSACSAPSATTGVNTGVDTVTANGEACIFNAPDGVSAGGLIGHVAWAFKVDYDKWVYGSTDGGTREKAKTWMQVGTKSDMLTEFYSGAADIGYYTQYKCKLVDNADALFAYNRVIESADKGYVWYAENCLYEAVEIMRLYGLKDMADPASRRLPNDYFYFNLPTGAGQWSGPIPLSGPSERPPARPAGDVPAAFLGRWTGGITQQNPPIPPFSLNVTIEQAPIGSTIASGNYTGTDPCTVHWTLLSAQANQIVVNEVVDSGTCFNNIQVTLTDLANGTLRYDFENGNGRGVLSR
jgi:hypothetical protein